MNRNYILIMMLLSTIAIGCQQQEIAIYNETPRVDFAVVNDELIFRDSTYLKNITTLEFEFDVNIVGFAQKNAMFFSLKPVMDEKVKPFLNPVIFNPYTMPAESYSAKARIKIPRPTEFDTPNHIVLTFEEFDGKNHQFEKGRIEFEQKNINVIYRINPGVWDNQTFGVYSNGKYTFIMDVLQQTYHDIEKNNETRDKLYNAYEKYLQTNDSIMDDSYPPRGIVFPKF